MKLKSCQKLQPILDEQELSLQLAADRTRAHHLWKSELRNYVFTKTWKLAIAIYLKINARKSWGFHARNNFSEEIYILK